MNDNVLYHSPSGLASGHSGRSPQTATIRSLICSREMRPLAVLPFCQIQRNNAEKRIRAIVEGKALPAASDLTMIESPEDETNLPADITLYAEDRIRDYIEQKFKGHGLAMADLWLANCYFASLSRPKMPSGPKGNNYISPTPHSK
jgi:hypothetical protein